MGAHDVALPTGVVTFLLTDVVGSTRLWDQDPVAMDGALARHDEIVESVVRDNDGVLLKFRGEGDSTFSVFRRASAGARAAAAVHRALQDEPWSDRSRPSIQVRMALHTGEAFERNGDYYGPAVNRAARLRAIAGAGEVLVSRSAAELLVEDVGEWRLVALGARALKDLSRPEDVHRLDWGAHGLGPTAPGDDVVDTEPVEPDSVSRFGSPRRAARRPVETPGSVFVGRRLELDALHQAWGRVAEGGCRAVLIGGEPGVGKTRLTAAFADEIGAAGHPVLHGRCDEDLGVAYQPFAQILSNVIDSELVNDVAAMPGAGELLRLVPQLSTAAEPVIVDAGADLDSARWALFEGCAAVIERATRSRPAVIVLDDLHWSAVATQLLFRHLLRSERPIRALFVATYRAAETDWAEGFGALLADLHREDSVDRIHLAGLGEDDVAELLVRSAAAEVDPRAEDLARRLHRDSDGNAFFVTELIRNLVESGDIFQRADGTWTSDGEVETIGLPASVRDVVTRRIDRLGDRVRDLLTVAAVTGSNVDYRVLEHVVGDVDDMLDAIDTAAAARLITDHGSWLTFNHALTRDSLLAAVGPARRMRLHRQIADAMRLLPDRDDHIESIARHLCECGSPGDLHAAEAAIAAGHRAVTRVAHEEAIEWFDRALGFLEPGSPTTDPTYYEAQLALAQAHIATGARARARDAMIAAGETALRLDDVQRLTEAARLASVVSTVGALDDQVVAILDEALRMAGSDHRRERVIVAADYANFRALFGRGERERARLLADEAMALAREEADPDLLARALQARAASMMGTSQVQEFRATVEELLALGPAVTDANIISRSHGYLATAVLQSADREAFDQVHQKLRDHQDSAPTWYRGYLLGAWDVSVALMAGDWARAEAQLDSFAAYAANDANALNVWAANAFILHRDTGRIRSFLPVMQEAADRNPGIVAFEAATALALGELGSLDEVGEIIERRTRAGFDTLPDDQMLILTLGCYAEAVGRIRDEHAATEILDLLEPFRGQLLPPPAGTMVIAPADRAIGILKAVLGRSEESDAHFAEALDFEERLGFVTGIPRTLCWHGLSMLRRGDPLAPEVLGRAAVRAERLGMIGVVDEARRLLGEISR